MIEIVTIFGVLLAVYTYIDSLFRESIVKSINEKGNSKACNNKKLIEKLHYQRNHKAAPLLIFSIIFFLLMIPDFITILILSVKIIFNIIPGQYSIIASTIILIPIIFLYWVILNIRMVCDLNKRISELSSDE